MTVKVWVWDTFDAQSRTPLLAYSEYQVESYGHAREMVKAVLEINHGKSAHGECDGPNQNYNSIWLSR